MFTISGQFRNRLTYRSLAATNTLKKTFETLFKILIATLRLLYLYDLFFRHVCLVFLKTICVRSSQHNMEITGEFTYFTDSKVSFQITWWSE